MKIKLDQGAFPLERAHATDAGLDIRTPVSFSIYPNGAIGICTGVHIQLPKGTAGFVKSKSGLMTKRRITTDGLVDAGYAGEIMVKLFNHSDKRWIFERGDKIAQLVIVPVLYEDVEVVDEIEAGERGENGFGSTGR